MKRLPALLTVLPIVLFAACAVLPVASEGSTTAVLLPNRDGNYKQMKPSSGSVHYTMVNESLCNGTTNYNFATSTIANRDSYGISVTSVGMGDGAFISQIDIVPCESRNTITTSTPVGSATSNVFYRWNGTDSADAGNYGMASSITPSQLATTTFSGLNLFKTSTSILEIGAMYATGTKGMRLSRIATRLTYTLTVPATPSGLVATTASSTQINLAWADNSNNELGFKVYRATNASSSVQIATTTTWNVQSYSDASVAKNNLYTYQIVAFNGAGTASSATSVADTYTTPPKAPTNLLATTASSSQISLTWTDTATTEMGFRVYRGLNGGALSQVATTTSNTVSYNDAGLAADQTYSYEVMAYNSAGTATSNVSTAITYYTVPVAPSGLTAASSTNSVALNWTDNSTNEDGFKIERSTDNVNFSQIATMGMNFASTTSYTDSTIVPGTTYYYRVRAYNAIGNSGYSGAAANLGVVTIPGGDITSTTSWNPFFIYVITAVLNVDAGARLNIPAGTIVKFKGADAKLDIASNATLDVEGGASSLVYLTSYNDDAVGGALSGSSGSPQPGDWDRIKMDAADTSATIAYAIIRYASNANTNHGTPITLWNNGGTLTLSNTEVATGTVTAAYGVYLPSGTTTITSCDIHGYVDGVEMQGGVVSVSSSTLHANTVGIATSSGGSLTLTGNTFARNTSGAATITLDGLTLVSSANTTTPSTGAVSGFILNGAVHSDQTWADPNVPYIIHGTVNVPSGTTLNIDAGMVLKFDATNAKLTVSGTLFAQGVPTATGTIYFTSYKDDSVGGDTKGDGASVPAAGDWDTIETDSLANTTIEYGVVRYGGYNVGPTSQSNLYNNGGTLDVVNSEVATSTNYGIYQGTGTTFILTTAIHHQPYGFYLASGSASIGSSNIHNNTTYGVYNATGSTLPATYNYWGDPSGPTYSSNPGGIGDKISDNVDFSNFLTAVHYFDVDSAGNLVSSVNGSRQILYDNQLTKYQTEWGASVSSWDSLGNITIATTTTATSDLTAVNNNYGFTAWVAQYIHDDKTIEMNEYWMDQSDYSGAQDQHTITHELGHALGLAHSYAGNIMYPVVNYQTSLGVQDKVDYYYLWP